MRFWKINGERLDIEKGDSWIIYSVTDELKEDRFILLQKKKKEQIYDKIYVIWQSHDFLSLQLFPAI